MSQRVLIIVENLSVPFDRRVWQESKALVAAGYDVSVICPMGTTYDTETFERIEGVAIHRYPLAEARNGLLGYVAEYGRALRHSRRIARKLHLDAPFDVVQICNPPDLLFLAVRRLTRDGALLVFDHHDLVPELFETRFSDSVWSPLSRLLAKVVRFFERCTFDRADAVLSTNESYRAVAIGRGGVPADRVIVVRSAPDLERFRERAPEVELFRGRAHLACYVGVMGRQDGVDEALRALAIFHHEFGRDDLHTIFVGTGPAFDEFVALAHELDLDEFVEFTGRIPDDELLSVLSTAEVGLAPDPNNPLNNVSSMNKVVEYMAVGTPVVSFDLLETRRTAGDCAVFAPAGDYRAFAAAIQALLDDPADRQRRAEAGRQLVSGELSWCSSCTALIGAYGRLSPRRSQSKRRLLRGFEDR